MGAAIYAWVPNPIERLGMMARAASAIAEARGKGWSSWGLTNAYQHCLMMCILRITLEEGQPQLLDSTYEYLQGNSYDDAMDDKHAMGLNTLLRSGDRGLLLHVPIATWIPLVQ